MNKERKNLLVFGYGLAIISVFLCWRISTKYGWNVFCWIFTVTCFISLWMTIWRQDLLKAFYKKWMKVAHAIGNVMTVLILSIIFYGIFGIVGLILRIMKKDLLHERLNRQDSSYWLDCQEKAFDKANYTRQF